MDIWHIIFYFLIIIPSAVVHEVAHGATALMLGDDTAKRAGRLTLNPLKHIDWFGSILLPISIFLLTRGTLLFAYAKPVPYNPYNLKSEKDEVKVALAGPGANFFIAIVFALIIRLFINIPIIATMSGFISFIVVANIGLGVFNLMPIPPLDGSKLLYLLIPKENVALRIFLNQYGIILLMFFIFFGYSILFPLISFITHLLLGPLSPF